MSTWSAIQAHMRGSYRLMVDEADVMAMSWSYSDGRAQRIVVRRFHDGGREMLEFKSPFAKQPGPDPIELLRENTRLSVGAIGLSSDVYVLIHNVPAEDLTLARLDDMLARVARQADRLESRYGIKDVF